MFVPKNLFSSTGARGNVRGTVREDVVKKLVQKMDCGERKVRKVRLSGARVHTIGSGYAIGNVIRSILNR